MKFNPDENFQKQARYGKSAIYIQNGHKFDAGYTHIGKADDPTDTPEKREAKKQDVRGRAAEKLRLKGFKSPDKPDAVQAAIGENEAARQAEELAE